MERLSKRVINAYGMTMGGFLILMLMNLSYYPFFLTDIVKITPTLMATILLAGRVADIISVPFVSVLLEKVTMPWGKFRSWMVVAPPLLAIFFIMMFSNPNLADSAKAVYLIIAYVVAHVFVNIVFGARLALMPLIGKHPEDRLLLSARVVQFGSLSAILFGMIAMPLMLYFTGAGADVPSLKGMTVTTVLLSIIMMITHFLLFSFTSKDDEKTVTVAKDKLPKLTLGEMVTQLLANAPFMSLLAGEIARNVATFLVSGIAAYYFLYVLGNMPMLAVFFTTIGFVGFGANLVIPYLCKYIDKRNSYLLGMFIMALGHLGALLFARTAVSFIVFLSIVTVGGCFTTVVQGALFSDATDYGEWKTGKGAQGFLMSITNIANKIGLAVTGGLTGFGLAAIGFEAGMEATPALADGLRSLMHLVPIGFCLVALIIVAFFNKLTIPKVNQIQQEVQARRLEAKSV